MTVDTDMMVSMTEANRNFSKVARLVEEKCAAVIIKNNAPCFLITHIRKTDTNSEASDEDVIAISQKLMAQNKETYAFYAEANQKHLEKAIKSLEEGKGQEHDLIKD